MKLDRFSLSLAILFLLSLFFSSALTFEENFSNGNYSIDCSYYPNASFPSRNFVEIGNISNFSYGWYCTKGHATNRFKNVTNTGGIYSHYGAGDYSNMLIHYFDNITYLNNDTIFKVSCIDNPQGTTDDREAALFLIDENNNVHHIPLTSITNLLNEGWINNSGFGANFGFLDTEIDFNECFYNRTIWQSIQNITQYNDIHLMDYGYKAIGYLVYSFTPSHKMGITNLTLYNYTLTNNLPSCNLNIENTNVCFDFDNPISQNISFNLTCVDQENNDIFYSLEQVNTYNKQLVYREDFYEVSPNGECLADYGFFTGDNFITNYSYPSSKEEQALNLLFHVFNIHYIVPKVEDNNCNARLITYDQVDRFAIDPGEPYLFDIEVWNRFLTPKNNTAFNVTFIDSSNNEIVSFKFNQTALGNLTVNRDGVNKFNKVHKTDQQIYFYIFMNKTGSYIKYEINYQDIIASPYTETYTKVITDWDNVRYNTYDQAGDNYWELQLITTEGSNFDVVPSWTSVKPSTFIVNNTGNRYLNIYVTDSMNINRNNFVNVSQLITVSEGYCPVVSGDPNKKPYEQSRWNIFNLFRFLSCRVSDDFGLGDWINKGFWIVYLIIFIALIILSMGDMFLAFNVTAWVGFILSFLVCANISIVLTTMVIALFTLIPLLRHGFKSEGK